MIERQLQLLLDILDCAKASSGRSVDTHEVPQREDPGDRDGGECSSDRDTLLTIANKIMLPAAFSPAQ